MLKVGVMCVYVLFKCNLFKNKFVMERFNSYVKVVREM